MIYFVVLAYFGNFPSNVAAAVFRNHVFRKDRLLKSKIQFFFTKTDMI